MESQSSCLQRSITEPTFNATPNSLINRPIDALRVPELLMAILRYLLREDLARAARVCQLWSPLAVELLWRKAPELKHLINTYSELVKLDIENNDITLWGFTDISSGGRWDVFLAYARLVHDLNITENEAFAPDVITCLVSHLERSPEHSRVLPNLRALSLKLESQGPRLMEILRPISGELRSLTVTSAGWMATSEALQRVLDHLISVDSLSQMSSITFDGMGAIADQSISVSRDSFIRQSRLTLVHLDLHLFSITTEELRRIGGIPGLQYLGIIQRSADYTWPLVAEFLQVIGLSFPRLRWISTFVNGPRTPEANLADIIRELARCGDLRSIWFACFCWGPLEKEDVRQFGRWWPSMERFELGRGSYPTDQDNPPIGILQDFAAVWSQTLQYLGLPFDGTVAAPSPSSIQVKFAKLDTLMEVYSRLPEQAIEPMADFIRAICSCPLQIKSTELPGDDSVNWRRVGDLVRLSQA